jgi:hypothetical protein
MSHRARPRTRTALAALALAAACGSRPPAPPLAHAAAAPPPAIPLIAARETGMFEITRDGADVRRVSATPAQRPRWLVPGRRLVFLSGDMKQLLSLELPAGKERAIAQLPIAFPACPPGGTGPSFPLQLHSDDDFIVEPARACIRLMDRNLNMASYYLELRVDLATGRTESYAHAIEAFCKLPRREPPSCDHDLRTFHSHAGPREHAGPAGFWAHSLSPTGRWAVLLGNREEGDHIFEQIALYEIATKRSFPIPTMRHPPSTGWPAPLTAEQLALGAEQLGQILDSVAGETPIYWLDGPDDRLVVEEALIVPGVRIVPVGQLAQ